MIQHTARPDDPNAHYMGDMMDIIKFVFGVLLTLGSVYAFLILVLSGGGA